MLWLRNKNLSWREIYWRIWAMTTTLYCTVSLAVSSKVA